MNELLQQELLEALPTIKDAFKQGVEYGGILFDKIIRFEIIKTSFYLFIIILLLIAIYRTYLKRKKFINDILTVDDIDNLIDDERKITVYIIIGIISIISIISIVLLIVNIIHLIKCLTVPEFIVFEILQKL